MFAFHALIKLSACKINQAQISTIKIHLLMCFSPLFLSFSCFSNSISQKRICLCAHLIWCSQLDLNIVPLNFSTSKSNRLDQWFLMNKARDLKDLFCAKPWPSWIFYFFWYECFINLECADGCWINWLNCTLNSSRWFRLQGDAVMRISRGSLVWRRLTQAWFHSQITGFLSMSQSFWNISTSWPLIETLPC